MDEIKKKIQLVLDTQAARQMEREAQRALDEGTDPREAIRNLKKVDNSTSRLGDTFKRLGSVIAGVFAFQAIRGFAQDMFSLGTAAEETGSKFSTVFGAASAKMQGFLDQWASLAGLNKTVAKDFAATTGAILQGMGFTQEASVDTSEQVLRLAGDLQSFNNIPIEQTFGAIKSALAGSWEPMDRLGIVLRQADVDTRALINTGKKNVDQLTQQEKVLATLALMYERAGVQVGDLGRTQDSTANRARELNAQFQDVRIEIAERMLPVFADMVGWLSTNKESIAQGAQDAATGVGAILTAVGELTAAIARPIRLVVDVVTKVNGIEQDIRDYFYSIPWLRQLNEKLIAGAPAGTMTPQMRARLGAAGYDVDAVRGHMPFSRPDAAAALGGASTAAPRKPGPTAPTPPTAAEIAAARRAVEDMVTTMLRRLENTVAGSWNDKVTNPYGGPPTPPPIVSGISWSGGGARVDVASQAEATFGKILGTGKDVAYALTDSWSSFFDTLFTGFQDGENVFESFAAATAGLGKAIVANMTEGMAQWQMAEGMAKLASGTWPPNPSALAASSLHFAAAGLFRALGGMVSGGGTRLPSVGRDPGLGIAQRAERQGAELHLYLDPLSMEDPRFRTQAYGAVQRAQEEYGNMRVIRHPYPSGGMAG